MSEVQTATAPEQLAEPLLSEHQHTLLRLAGSESYRSARGRTFYAPPYSWTFVRDAGDRTRARVLRWVAPVGAMLVIVGMVVAVVPGSMDHTWAQALAVALVIGPFATAAAAYKWVERGLWRPKFELSVELARRFVVACDGADAPMRAWLDAMRPGLFELLGDLEVAVDAAHQAGDVTYRGEQSPQAATREDLLSQALDVTAFALTASAVTMMPVDAVPDVPLDGATPARRRMAVAMLFMTRPPKR